MEATKWNELDVKTKVAYISAIVAFIVGWGLTIAGFIVPPVGIITESVLWVLGQALVYSASVFGVAMYTTGQVKAMKREIREYQKRPSDENAE